MSDQKPILSMAGVSKSFSDVPVLKDVNFDLSPGEVHILAGENGAGKTTLIKVLAGVHTDYTGEIRLHGKFVRFKSPHEASVHGISAIHQDMSLVNSMSVADNLFLGRENTRKNIWMDFRRQRERAAGLLKQLNISADLDSVVGDLPVSIRQMIEIAKALVHDARVIIMDEPTSALSSTEVERLFSIIADLKRRGCGIIYISHRMEEIYTIADRITVLRDGKYIGTSAVRDLPREDLIQWMVGRTISQQFPPRISKPGPAIFSVRDFSLPDPFGVKRWAVENLSFDLHSGEILGIAGLQGSGKSEFLNGLFGTYGRVDQGQVDLEKSPFPIRSPALSIRHGVALLTNDRKGTGLVPTMAVRQNITLASLKDVSPGGWMNPAREEAAARQDVSAYDIKVSSPRQEVQTLSGGNQQKVVLAKWLRIKPKVLLLDEPTIGVDVGAKHEIYELMNNWTAQGIAILLITSELPELLAMSDRIIVLHRGRITSEFARGQATQQNVIEAAMGKEATH
jgi:ribose transport system ATP-binding protein